MLLRQTLDARQPAYFFHLDAPKLVKTSKLSSPQRCTKSACRDSLRAPLLVRPQAIEFSDTCAQQGGHMENLHTFCLPKAVAQLKNVFLTLACFVGICFVHETRLSIIGCQF